MGDGCHPRCHPREPLASCPWRDPVPPRAPSPCATRGPCGVRDKAASWRYWANWERGALPFVVQGQSGSERAQRGRRDGDGDGWGPAGGVCVWGGGETCLTPKHGPEGERGRRAGTYRKGGSGTEADLLHGAEQQAAGGHAALAPRLGDGFTGGFGMGPPEPSSVPHRRPGGGQVLPQWEPGNASPPSLRPSFLPSFPPSAALAASPHPCQRAGTKVSHLDGSQLDWEGRGGGNWGRAVLPPCAQRETRMHPKKTG